MDEKRVVYAPVELPYMVSPLEEMLEAAVAVVGRRLSPPKVEFEEGVPAHEETPTRRASWGAPPEIVVSRECFPHRGLSPSYRKWLKVPPGSLYSGPGSLNSDYGNQKQTSRQTGKLAMPICDSEVHRILTSPALLDHESVCFDDGQLGINFTNCPALDVNVPGLPIRESSGDMNDYYSSSGARLLRMIAVEVGHLYPDFAEIAHNYRPGRHGMSVRLSGHATRILMEAATVYAFSEYDESASGDSSAR